MFPDLSDFIDFSAVFIDAPIAMCVSQNQTILACNDAATSLFGNSRTVMLGKSWAFLYPSAVEFERSSSEIESAMTINRSYVGDRSMRRCSGELFWCRLSGVAMLSDQKLKRQIWTFTELRAHGDIYQTLSPREREVAALLVAGNTSKMIAGKVGLSPRTVEFYRRGLTQKLSATSFSDLIAKLINNLTESTVAVNSDIGRA